MIPIVQGPEGNAGFFIINSECSTMLVTYEKGPQFKELSIWASLETAI